VNKEKHVVEKELESWFLGSKRVLIVGVGNPIRRDDFIGVRIVHDLRGKVSHRVCLVESETVPENSVQQIADFKPTHILLIDAAVLGLKAGESKLVKPQELTNFPAYSTHMLPLRIFCECVEEMTKAKIAMLLVEPEDTDFGEGLTPAVRASAEQIARALLRLVPQ
jgi:hydrogenase 3 maturation protease